MQTPAEKYLIKTLESFLYEHHNNQNSVPKILNVGAGRSTLIEERLVKNGVNFICDRVEIEDVQVSGYGIRNCYHCSVESMYPVKSEEYHAVFSNYVLEHVQHLNGAASEIYRVLKPGGIFVASIPNPTAPESLLAKVTPLWFHKLVRGREAFETHYTFKNIKDLSIIFQKSGFDTVDVFYRSFILSYLERFIILNKLACLYDGIMDAIRFKRFMNNICIVFRKPASIVQN